MIPRPNREFQSLVHQFKADYDAMIGSEHARARPGVSSLAKGSDYHIRSEAAYFRMLELERDLRRNDTIIEKTIERSTLNIIGEKFLPAPDTGDRKLDADLFDDFEAWATDADRCDESGEHTFHELLALAVHNSLADGDTITLGLDNDRLQMHEAHLCRNPRGEDANGKANIVIGVEVGPTRKRLAYYLRAESVNPRGNNYAKKSKRYPTRDKRGTRQVFHLYYPTRYSATRGVTALAPIVLVAQMFEDLNFAKLVQAKIVSLFNFYRYRDASAAGGSDLPTGPTPLGATDTQSRTDGSTRTTDDVEPGTEIPTAPGEEIRTVSAAGTPNSEYFPHAKLLLTLIGINLGQPYVMMLMDASESNFTGWRAAVEEARRGFRRNQQGTVNRFATPIYRWRLARLAAKNAAYRNAEKRLGQRFYRHAWRLPTWPYVSPLEDATTGLMRVRNGLTSPRRYHGELSQDWEEIATEIVLDNSFAIRRARHMADKLNKGRPPETHVHWRELLSLPAPEGVAIQVNPAAAKDSSK